MDEAYERYQLPHEAARLAAEWMTPAQAAKAWGVSERTARRYFAMMYTWPIATVNVRTDRVRIRRMLPVGTAAPEVAPTGNPHFTSSEYQKDLSARRWEGHIKKADRDAFKAEVRQAEFEKVLASLPPLGMPQPPDDGDWQPWPEAPPPEWPTDAQGTPLPPQLVYPDQDVRERMRRKAKRDPRVRWYEPEG